MSRKKQAGETIDKIPGQDEYVDDVGEGNAKCPGFERCHPCAWIPCSPYARRLQKKRLKVDTGYKPDRWPTDFLCLFFFAMFWVGMSVIPVLLYGVVIHIL
jgi:hypothetical protein